MTTETIHELAAIAELTSHCYDKRAAVDRLVADGRAEVMPDRSWRLTEVGERWVEMFDAQARKR